MMLRRLRELKKMSYRNDDSSKDPSDDSNEGTSSLNSDSTNSRVLMLSSESDSNPDTIDNLRGKLILNIIYYSILY
jgi:hypothetical protein